MTFRFTSFKPIEGWGTSTGLGGGIDLNKILSKKGGIKVVVVSKERTVIVFTADARTQRWKGAGGGEGGHESRKGV